LLVRAPYVLDFSPLERLPLREIQCDFRPNRHAKSLRAMRTLATINTVLCARSAAADAGGRRRGRSSHKPIPYIFLAPERPSEIGAIAARVYREHYACLLDQARSPSIALLGRAFNAGQSPARGELFSYLFFAREFAEALMRRGREDARRWLDRRHDEGPWRLRKPPL